MSRLSQFKILSFDVYGTLINWEGGMLAALQPLLSANNATSYPAEDLFRVIHELESEEQKRSPGMQYSELLATIHPRIATKLGWPAPSAEESKSFGDSVGKWPAFPDTVEALKRLSKHYKLLILSNVDRESFAGTNSGPLQGFPFDLIVTAQDVGSYKPDPRNFEYMLKTVKEKFGIEKEHVLQTAQSQFHDHHPAKAAGIKSCWIVRPGAKMGHRDPEIYNWKFNTLGEMADALEADLA